MTLHDSLSESSAAAQDGVGCAHNLLKRRRTTTPQQEPPFLNHRILPHRFRSHSPILWRPLRSLPYRFIKAARQLSRVSSWCSCPSRISVRDVKGHFLGSSLYRTKSLVRTILAKGVARTSVVHEIALPKTKPMSIDPTSRFYKNS